MTITYIMAARPAVFLLYYVFLIPAQLTATKRSCYNYSRTYDCSFAKALVFPIGIPKNTEWVRVTFTDLTEIPATAFRDLPNLYQLCLNNNKLTSLPPGIFDTLSNLQALSLQNNNLHSIPHGLFDGLVDLQRIRLYGNSLNCSECSILYLRNWLRKNAAVVIDGIDQLFCSNSKVPVVSISVEDLEDDCSIEDDKTQVDAYTACLCNDAIVDCRDKVLTTVPSNILNTTKTLILQLNIIEQLSITAFANLEHLKFLDLSWNYLRSLPLGVFDQTFNLEHLDLRQNGMKRLPAGLFDHTPLLHTLSVSHNLLSSIPSHLIDHLDHLKSFSARKNPWVCDCNIVGFSHWLRNHRTQVRRVNEIRCASSKNPIIKFDTSVLPNCSTNTSRVGDGKGRLVNRHANDGVSVNLPYILDIIVAFTLSQMMHFH
uniref:phospholipase A2 inhibitor-like isoform X1 n=2 Tax=Myxine glutinosa TaxID=7769 RepID=UPI00358F796E